MRKTGDCEKGFTFKTESGLLVPGGLEGAVGAEVGASGPGSSRLGGLGQEGATRLGLVLSFRGSRINAVLLSIIASFLWLV